MIAAVASTALATGDRRAWHEAQAARSRNIVVIWGDDIGQSNLSAYTHGLMGYRRPTSTASREGMMFTDYYAEQSCTAGRASFITGQRVLRTGLTKVGMPGARRWACSKEDPTIAELLKPQGYATGQFGKNHLGDRTSSCPPTTASTSSTATSITSMPRRSRSSRTIRRIRSSARSSARAACSTARPRTRTTPPNDPRFGKVGKQVCKDTGPLTKKRMETIDDDIAGRGDGLHQAPGEGRQAVLRVDQHHAHAPPHAHQARKPGPGRAGGRAPYHDTMIDHDKNVGTGAQGAR